MSNQINNSNIGYSDRYVRRNNGVGFNPLCDKLRSQYRQRIDEAVNRSLVRTRELEEEARRNGWDRVRRPAPTYKVSRGLWEPSFVESTETVKTRRVNYAEGTKPQVAVATAGAEADNGMANRPKSVQKRGVNAMVGTNTAAAPRGTFDRILSSVDGREYGREDEKRVEGRAFPTGAVFLVVVCAMLFMLVVYCSMQKSEVQNSVSDMQSRVEELSGQYEELSLKLEMKDDLTEIERIALNEIGMVKRDSVGAKFVSVGGMEKDTNLEENSAPAVSSSLLSVFGGKLRAIVEYLN